MRSRAARTQSTAPIDIVERPVLAALGRLSTRGGFSINTYLSDWKRSHARRDAMVDDMKASQESGASTSAMERQRHVAWILILITDARFIAWGVMAAALPEG